MARSNRRLIRSLVIGLAILASMIVQVHADDHNSVEHLEPMSELERDPRKLRCGPTKKRHSPLSTFAASTTSFSTPLTTASTTTAPDTTTSTTPYLATTFCVVADAPYRHSEYLELLDQVQNMDDECEFVAHLGDIRSARNYDTCVKETYTNASFIMKKSQKPVLMMLGGKPFARSE